MSGPEFREIREGLGLSQRDLAGALCLNPASVSNFESGRASIRKVVELALRHVAYQRGEVMF